jgi:N,N-dimethylformamidase beta subunit-like, C-terminal
MQPNQPPHQTARRSVLKGIAAAGLGLPALGAQQSSSGNPRSRAIQAENSNAGTTDWQLTRIRLNDGKFRTSLIEGYCSHQSISAGQTLKFFVSTQPRRSFTIDVYRMGYYGGTGGRHMLQLGPISGKAQPTPEIGPVPGRLRECRWEASQELTIPDDWVSGVYLGKLTTIPDSRSDPYWQSYVVFIVRDDRRADILFQCGDNTWQAYNRWPVNESLYTHPDGAHAPGVAVSFDRPYGMYTQIFEHPLSVGSGEFLLWEFPLCHWLEQQGYDVTYGSNSDTTNEAFVTRCRTFVSVGHDEYWDQRQYRAVEKGIGSGTSVLWLCGNSVFIDSPFSANAAGQPNRRIHRAGCYGPLRHDETESYAAMFAGLKSTGPDERRIIGARSVVPFNGGGDWTCVKPDHWVFDGTNLRSGDYIPGLVGWEHHGEPDPDREGLEVLAEGSVWAGGVREGRYSSTIFSGRHQNIVFNAATIFWSQGLSRPPGHIIPWSHGSRPHGPDARVQRITANLLGRAIS